MTTFRFNVGYLYMAILVLTGMGLLNFFASLAFCVPVYIPKEKTVVIDPGHGGNDRGAFTLQLTEKSLTLKLALLLEKNLTPVRRVVLSRRQDVGLAPFERASISNNAGGNTFISLHIGGGFVPKNPGIVIFVDDNTLYDLKNSTTERENAKDQEVVKRWDEAQKKYGKKSMWLAKNLQKHLIPEFPNVAVRIEKAPLAVLKGVDMPAVLVEIGCLKFSGERLRLNEEKFLQRLADTIGAGILATEEHALIQKQ
jgi:N-acetylmuramoyl-L-alanine amidase